MRKNRAVLAAVGLAAVLGALAPAATAQAAPSSTLSTACDNAYNSHKGDGYVRAYYWANCDTLLGAASGDDSNWSDTSGPFQGTDNDNARSVVNTGTYSGGVNDVLFYRDAGYTGGYGCLDWNELYVDDLSRNTFTSGTSAQDNISSHKWVNGCPGNLWH
ncbi:hypothetical protein [Streptomyces sp. NPDC086766]|uniref:hypothetical protein n=1 Tax=Streptomyces sp. NPDC086766 TaxID=3365754 RepID=UPI0037FA96DB